MAADPLSARLRPLAWGMTAALVATLAANVFYLTMTFYYFYVFATLAAGQDIGSYTTVDATWRWSLPTGTTVALSLFNILDEEPPFARLLHTSAAPTI